ncbi:MAG: hypothetical protein H6581_27520 [Bacteroidia bacterium]|nr:hypothetical protein [Bacteroidia bacterium]
MIKFEYKILLAFLLLAGTSFLGLQAQLEENPVAEIDSLVKVYERAKRFNLKKHEISLDVTPPRGNLETVFLTFFFLQRSGEAGTSTPPFLTQVMVRVQGANKSKRVVKYYWSPNFGLMYVEEDNRENPCGITCYYMSDERLLQVTTKVGESCPEKNSLKNKVHVKEQVELFEKKVAPHIERGKNYQQMFQMLIATQY